MKNKPWRSFPFLIFLLSIFGSVWAVEFKDLTFFELVEVHTDAAGQNTCQNIRKYAPENRKQLTSLVEAASQFNRKIIITGSNHSMAGQVTCHGDSSEGEYILLTLNAMPIKYNLSGRHISISAQATWLDLIKILKESDSIGPGLAPSIMQDFSVFTIGGTLSANAMGRDPNFGPVIESVQSLILLKADGEVIECSRQRNSNCFEAVIGGYGAFGVILSAKILLVPDVGIQPVKMKMDNDEYADHLRDNVVGVEILDKHYGTLTIENGRISVTVQEYYKVTEEGLPYWVEKLDRNRKFKVRTAVQTRREYLENHRFSQKWGALNNSNQLLGVAVPLQKYETFSNSIFHLVSNFPNLNFDEITTKYVPAQLSTNMLQLITQDSVVFVFNIESRIVNQASIELFKRRLYQLTKGTGGKAYLAFDLPRDSVWLKNSYPRSSEWLALKREYDPGQVFYSKFFHQLQLQLTAPLQ